MRSLQHQLPWLVASLLIARAAGAQTTYYVSPAGSDAAPDTDSAPLQTLQKGAELPQPGDTVLVRAGTYKELISTPRSGTAS